MDLQHIYQTAFTFLFFRIVEKNCLDKNFESKNWFKILLGNLNIGVKQLV